MMNTISDAKKRLPLNVIINFINLIITTAIGLWLTPYLIGHFGVAVYGILPLLLSLLRYFGLVSGALTPAIARFITLNIQNDNYQSANEYYSTAVFSVAIMGLLLLMAAISVLPWLENVISIPDGYITQTKGLFLLVVLSTIMQVFSTVFNVGFFANHRFDLQYTINIIGTICKALFIGLVLAYLSETLYIVGGGYLLLSAILVISGYLYLIKLEPNLELRRSLISYSAMKQMTGMGGWTLLINIGVLLYYNIDYLIINRMLGAEMGGMYAPVIQITLLVTVIVSSLNHIFSPIIIGAIAHNDIDGVRQYTYRAIRYIGLIILLPIMLLCGFSKSVLILWLGESFSDLYKLMWLLMIPSILYNSIRPLFALLNGLNAVKYIGIVTILGGLLNLALSISLVKYTSLGLYAVASATVLSLFIRNIIFLPLYSMKLIGGKVSNIYRTLMYMLFSCILVIGMLYWVDTIIPPKNLIMLIIYCAICSLVYLLLLFGFILEDNEKRYWLSLISRKRDII